jgi:SNF2 family DNA or RNA helicase
MWNSIVNIFKNDTSLDAKPVDENVLNEHSPRMEPPAICCKKVTLWVHQKTMLARCKYIEAHPVMATTITRYHQRYMFSKNIQTPATVALGVMNDPPGAGKTYVMLALIASDFDSDDNPNSTTIIVAPKNILEQWKESITMMFGPMTSASLPWTIATYSSINNLYIEPDAFFKYRIVLLEQILTDAFAIAYASQSINNSITTSRGIHRVVFDEIDNMSRSMTEPIKSDKVWFMSASFVPNDELVTKNIPYLYDSSLALSMICRTDPLFIQANLKLPPPKIETIICEDSDIQLFRDIVPNEIMTSLHVGNSRILAKYIGYTDNSRDLKEIAIWYSVELGNLILKMQQNIIEGNILKLKDIENAKNMSEKELNDHLPVFNKFVESISNTSIKLEKSIIAKTTLDNRLTCFVPPGSRAKTIVLETDVIIPKILGNPLSKWIVFNDEFNVLIDLNKILIYKGITCEALDGGTITAVNRTIAAFKAPASQSNAIQVLLINSATEGCGLNLETATDILFMHASKQNLIEQVVGRAQRYGRTECLRIICLMNRMELEE